MRKMPEPQPAFQFIDLRQQHDVAQLGMWAFIATEILFFGGLILAYCVYRTGHPDGFAEAGRHTKIVIGTANTAILLTSSFLVAWAVAMAKLRLGRVAGVLLWGAALLGVVFLALKGIEYLQEYEEQLLPGIEFAFSGPDADAVRLFFAFYLVATGLHALHVVIGIVTLAVIGRQAYRQRYSDRYYAPIMVAGLYWHFVDVVWIVLFALIYLPGRAA
jgi:cytochrome c oxidase subunit 3